MFRAVKRLNLTFLPVQALLKEPPDLLQEKAVLKGEKRILLSEKFQALVSQFNLLELEMKTGKAESL